MAIKLDENQLKDFIKEQVKQVLTAHSELQDELGVTVIPRFKMRFSAQVVAQGGLNAVSRRNISVTDGERVSLCEEQPYVEKSTRSNTTSGRNTENNETSGSENQDNRTEENGTQGLAAENKETAHTVTQGNDKSTTRTDASNKEDSDNTDNQTSAQTQTQGTVSQTTTEYAR